MEFTLKLESDAFAVWDSTMTFTVEPGAVELLLEDGGRLLWKGTLQIKE